MKALIIYSSLTGNTQEMAELLAEKLKALKVDAEAVECVQADADEFLDYDICVVATYTYGTDGELPDEILDFYEDLEGLNLSNKVFGVLGSGQTFYEHFCRAVDYFEDQFLKTKATKGAESLKFELDVSPEEEYQLEDFAASLVQTAKDIQ